MPFEDSTEGDGEMPLSQLDDFIVAGRDDKGGQVTITVNVPPAIDRQLDVILACRRFPYANKRDIVRHAIIRHFIWLHLIRQSVPRHIMSALEAILEECKDDEVLMKMEQVFLTLQGRIADHEAHGDVLEATRLVSIVNQKARELKPSAWVRRFMDRFLPRYGSYLRINRNGDDKKE